MQRVKAYSEYRTVILTVIIIIVVAISGVILYKNLSGISKKVSESIKTTSPPSIISKQILIELRSAENNSRAYKLTQDITYVRAFYNTLPDLESQISLLKKVADKSNYADKILIDSIILLSRKRFTLIKQQSYLEDPVKVTNELNVITQKIDEEYKTREELALKSNVIQKTDSVKKKKGFLKRLFGKKETKKDTIQNKQLLATITPKTNSDSKNKLKNTVLKVKSNQAQQLANYKQNEYQLSQEGISIMDKINTLAETLKKNEDYRDIQKSNDLEVEVNKIKYYSIIFSCVIALFLFVLINLIRNYINKKNEYEIALLESKQVAEDLAKAKETFLANMSHEIKTPLNAIYGFTEQILSSELKPEQEKQLNIVKNSVAYLTKLVNNILTYTKLQAGKSQLDITNFNLKKELLDIEELFKNQAKLKGIELVFQYDNIIPETIKSDLNKIKQILFNIIGNAIKFTNKGKVNVTLKAIETNEVKTIEFKIEDTGRGMEEEKLSKLFNEYEQGDTVTHKKYGGTGLGLVITKQIVDQLSGSITITSQVKIGTSVTIILPIEEVLYNQTITETDTRYINRNYNLNGLKILIVDDEEFNRLLLKSILKKFNISVFEAVNGNEAITLIKNQSFDLVIMDVRMPEKNGIDATIEIRKFEKKLPILAATAVINEEKIAKCMQVGMNGILFKPFAENELIEKITDILSNSNKSHSNFVNKTIEQKHLIKKNKIINLENLDEYLNNDKAFKTEMIQLFYKTLNNGIVEIEKHAFAKNYLNLGEIAHKIIPSCKHFEAYDLYNTFKYFEKIRNQSDFEINEFNSKLAELKQQISNVNKELEAYLKIV